MFLLFSLPQGILSIGNSQSFYLVEPRNTGGWGTILGCGNLTTSGVGHKRNIVSSVLTSKNIQHCVIEVDVEDHFMDLTSSIDLKGVQTGLPSLL